jgi:hypothetical protein
MRKQTKVRLCLALLALVSVLGVGLTGTEATAAPCCSSCDYRFESCLAGTYYYPECNGDPGCCDQKVSSCWHWCSFSC